MKKSSLYAGIVTALLAPALVTIGSGEASGAAAPVLVSGTIGTDSGGRTTPLSGAQVSAWWVPGMESSKVGDELPIVTVASDTTDANGSYTLAVTPNAAMRNAAADNGSWVNFEVGVVDPSGSMVETGTVSRVLADGAWSTSSGQTAAAARVTGAGTEQGPEAVVDTPARESTLDFEFSSQSERAPVVANQRSAAAAREVPCSFVTLNRPNRAARLLEFHNASNADARWAYGESADSDLEGGIDYSGNGGWRVKASAHISNNVGSQVTLAYKSGKSFDGYGTSTFNYVDGYAKPYGQGTYCSGTSWPVGTKFRNPVKWEAGVGSSNGAGSEFIGCSRSPQSSHRAAYPNGGSYYRYTNRAAKIGAAVDLGPITVGNTSGYSKKMDMFWNAVRGSGIWLCGTNSGHTTAGVVHAQNR